MFVPNYLHYHKQVIGAKVTKVVGKMSVVSLPEEYHSICTEILLPSSIIKQYENCLWIHANAFRDILKKVK